MMLQHKVYEPIQLNYDGTGVLAEGDGVEGHGLVVLQSEQPGTLRSRPEDCLHQEVPTR